jgi:hypothetical protein
MTRDKRASIILDVLGPGNVCAMVGGDHVQYNTFTTVMTTKQTNARLGRGETSPECN